MIIEIIGALQVAFIASYFWSHILWFCLKRHFGYWERRKIIHTKPLIPCGNMDGWLRSKHITEIFSKTYCQYYKKAPFVGFFFNTQRAAFVLDLNLAGEVLVNNYDSFEHRGFFHNERNDPLTGNLFLLDGPKWKILKTKLAPLFTGAKMKYLFPSLLKVGAELQKVLQHKINTSEDGIFEMTAIMDNYSFDIILRCVFGLECYSLNDPDNPFCKMARKFLTFPRHTTFMETFINCFPEWAKRCRLKVIPTDVAKVFTEVATSTIKYSEKYKIRNADFLQLLIDLKTQIDEAGGENQWTLEEMTSQAFGFFINGFQTCSSTMSFLLYEVAQNQNIQNKVRQEIEQTLSRKQELTYECLKKMKYLGQVISETWRKYPPMPALFRKCTKKFIPPFDKEFYIDKGCRVIIPTFCYHNDPNYFPNPKNFDPDRWIPQNKKHIRPFSYLPFGDGPRKCIGMIFGRMQIKIGLIMLLKNFKFTICEKTVDSVQIFAASHNMKPTNVHLKVTKVK